ncbi:MAG: hypothetical protein IJ180_07910 [Bacteroidales bacterium]|nr:hypothetical protein [Bacteroidales bacterium]
MGTLDILLIVFIVVLLIVALHQLDRRRYYRAEYERLKKECIELREKISIKLSNTVSVIPSPVIEHVKGEQEKQDKEVIQQDEPETNKGFTKQIFYLRKSNENIFDKFTEQRESKSVFILELKDESHGEYRVIEEKINTNILPGDFAECIVVKGDRFTNKYTTLQKGLVEKDGEDWRITQILKIQLED